MLGVQTKARIVGIIYSFSTNPQQVCVQTATSMGVQKLGGVLFLVGLQKEYVVAPWP